MLMTSAIQKIVKRFQTRQLSKSLHFEKQVDKLTPRRTRTLLVKAGVLTKSGNLSSIYRTTAVK